MAGSSRKKIEKNTNDNERNDAYGKNKTFESAADENQSA